MIYIMQRTQLYMDPATLRRLKKLGAARKTTVSALVREAVEQTYFAHRPPPGWRRILDEASGTWEARDDLGDSTDFVRSLRKGTRQGRLRQ